MGKRMKISLIGGAILGIFCVIGAYVRSGFTATSGFVFSLWYNRLMLGLVIGAPWSSSNKNESLVRGGVLGLIVSFAFYTTTGFKDPVSFIAGIIYGIILEALLVRSEKQ